MEDVQRELITSREGIGEIIHYAGREYELMVGLQPYCMVDESRWELILSRIVFHVLPCCSGISLRNFSRMESLSVLFQKRGYAAARARAQAAAFISALWIDAN